MSVRTLSLLLLGLGTSLASAQQPSTDSQQPYTLHTDVRVVLADVTVTDRNGSVVHDLPASAFHVTIDRKPLPLASFEEHNVAPTAIAATPVAGTSTFSNEYLLHLPPVLNIVVLDTATLQITEQMYLAYEFKHFLEQLPASRPLAIYARTGDHLVLIQDFTSDHALLTAAAAKVMPRIPTPHTPSSDVTLLAELAQHLTPIPGRKSVLWFSGGSGVFQMGDPDVIEDVEAMRQVYDQLEAARVALYPIDARGLETDPGNIGRSMQHLQMNASAEATGGQAFVDMNALKDIAQTVLRQDSSYYTLTFTPKDFKPDNKWHKIHISLDKPGYSLSYRNGYFADGSNMTPTTPKPGSRRDLLVADGKTLDVPPDLLNTPVIFTASIVSAAQRAGDPATDSNYILLKPPVNPRHGATAHFIRYTLPPGVILAQTKGSQPQVTFDVTALAFSQSGVRIGQNSDRVRLTLAPASSTLPICVEQQIDLPKGEAYLFLAVLDVTSGRLGTLQIPIIVK